VGTRILATGDETSCKRISEVLKAKKRKTVAKA
jgi:hypothetical protein